MPRHPTPPHPTDPLLYSTPPYPTLLLYAILFCLLVCTSVLHYFAYSSALQCTVNTLLYRFLLIWLFLSWWMKIMFWSAKCQEILLSKIIVNSNLITFCYGTCQTPPICRNGAYLSFINNYLYFPVISKVEASTLALDPTCSFVLDAGLKIYIWSGERVRIWQVFIVNTRFCGN